MTRPVTPRVRVVITIAFYGLLAWFLARYLRGADWSRLAELRWSPLYLLLAFPLSLLPRLLQPLAWRILIAGYGETPPPYPQITRVYATSWLGRYIPGKVASIGAKVFFGRAYGLSAPTLAATSVAEAAIQMMTALGLAFVIFGLAGQWEPLGPAVRMLSIVAFAAMAVALAPPVFNALAGRVARLLGRADARGAGRLRAGALFASAALYVVIHALSGLPIWLIVAAMYDAIPLATLPALTASFLLAGTLGTLAVFAPSGLGVREGILMVLLAAMLPKSVAAVAVVVLRLWSIAMDVVFYGIAVLLDRWRPSPFLTGPSPGTARSSAER